MKAPTPTAAGRGSDGLRRHRRRFGCTVEQAKRVAIRAVSNHATAQEKRRHASAVQGSLGKKPTARCYFPLALGLLVLGLVIQSASAGSSVVGWGENDRGQTITPAGLSNVVAIAAAVYHSLALTADGRVIGWGGDNEWGETTIPDGLSNVVAIAAGGWHSLALTAGSRVVGWGENRYGQTNIPGALSNVVAIAAGAYHNLALTADGQVVGWGDDSFGQTNIPDGLSNVVAIAAGGGHSLALMAGSRVVGWGDNRYGQATIPNGLSNVIAIASSGNFSLALTADGQVVGWGENDSAQADIPSGLRGAVAIAVGGAHNLALTADGYPIAWGDDDENQTHIPSGLSNVVAIAAGEYHSLALIRLSEESGPPLIVSPRVALATVGHFFQERIVTGTTADGYGGSGLPPGLAVDTRTGLITGIPSAPGAYSVTLYATNVLGVAERTLAFQVNVPLPGLSDDFVSWNQGREFYYRAAVNAEWVSGTGLPPGLTLDAQTGVISGVPIWQGDFAVSLTASNRHGSVTGTLTIRIASPIVGWGNDSSGQTTSPIGLSNVVAIAAGWGHSLALTADGHVVGWGYNYSGQTNIPDGLSNVVAIAAGWGHNLALTASGQVVGWGYNGYGQTNIPDGLSNVVAIAAGGGHNLALTAEGQVVGWGWNDEGQTTIPSGLSNVVAIAGGFGHSLALTAGGQVVGWGWNGDGQTTIPSGLSNVVAIAAGERHSLALTADGQVVAWGENTYGQTSIPSGLTNAVTIAASAWHSLALTADGKVVGWGGIDSPYDQTNIPSRLGNVVAIAAGGFHNLALIGLSGPPLILTPRVALATVDRFFHERIVTGTTADGYGANGLPPGLTIDTRTGLITGIPSVPGTYSVILYATNATGVAERRLTLHVNLPLPGLAGDFVFWSPGREFYYRATTANSEWASAVGLPPGLVLDAQSGVISGLPLRPGDFRVSLTTSNRYGSATGTLTIRIVTGTLIESPVVGWGDNQYGQTTIPSGLSNVVAITAGGNHSLALTAGGDVVAWGDNRYGQLNSPSWLHNWVAIAAGGRHSLALTADGQVVGWGRNDEHDRETTTPGGLSNVVAIAAGWRHSLALTANGQVVGWGWNDDGQTTIPSGLSNVVAIAAGWIHSLALTADGEVVGWGANDSGQTTIPNGLSNVVAIAAGADHSLALTADGHVVGWGGQTTIPGGLSNVVAIAAGAHHGLALTAGGQVAGWGQTTIPGGLSNVVAIAAGGGHSLALVGLPAQSGPPLIISPRVVIATVGRFFHERIVTGTTADGYGAGGLPPGLAVDTRTGLITGTPSAPGSHSVTLYATNVSGVAERTLVFHVNLPLPGLSADFVSWNQGRGFNYRATVNSEWVSAAGLPRGLALDAQTGVISGVPLSQGDFLVSLMASNRYGSVTGAIQIRIASPIASWGYNQTASPVGLSNVVAIAAGLALTADGLVTDWGGWPVTATFRSGLSNVVAIAAGGSHRLALTAEGQVVGWGSNFSGQTNVLSGLNNVVAIAAGTAHSLALTAEGRVVGWGESWAGQTNIPSGLSNVVAIAAGRSHSLALTAERHVIGWGGNYNGQTNTPTELSNVVAIAAGGSHSLALTADGQVVGWGDNSAGQTTIPVGLSNVVAIAAGELHSLALTADGQVVSWGSGPTSIPSGLTNVVAIAAGAYHSLALIGLPGEFVPPRPVLGPGHLALTIQPVNHTVVDGNGLEFVVMAVGQGELSYRWQRDGTNLVGATGNRLPFINAQPENSGNYTCIVSNALGSVTSRVARLTVLLRPRLASLPPKVFTGVGSNVTLTANATGTPPLRYQWRKNGANIPGATNATFTIPNAQISDGGSYTVFVANDVGITNSDPILLIVLVPAQPPGDNFAQRVAVSGLTNSVGATNFFATKETGEPNHGGKPGGKSVWYTWRAPTNGIATFRTSGSVFDTLLGIYTNDFSLNPQPAISNLVTVAGDEDRGGFYTSEARFNAAAGADYQIAVDGFAGAAGDFVLSWELEPTGETLPVITNQPAGRVVMPGSTVTFTAVATETNVTYQWLFNGAVLAGRTTSSLTLSNVQRANVGFYSVRVRNNSGREIESLAAALELGGRAGERLSEDKLEDLFNPPGTGGNSGGGIQPATAGAFLVSLGSIDYRIVNNTRSATQQGEPTHCGTLGNATSWLLLQPESDGTFVIDTRGSDIATVLAVYTTGATAFDAPLVACDDDGTADGSRVRFSAMANREYYVVADGANYAKGLIQLNWQFGVPPPVVTNGFARHQLRPGGSVVLQAPTTNGIPPPHFRWFWNGRVLAGQTNAWLSLSQLQSTNSGYYTVEVDNGIGAVTQTTQIEVEEPMLLTAEPQLSQSMLRLHLPAAPISGPDGLIGGVILEVTSDLGDPGSWRPVYTNQAAAIMWEAPTTNVLQFFRVRRWP